MGLSDDASKFFFPVRLYMYIVMFYNHEHCAVCSC